jgi:hypothetical protein
MNTNKKACILQYLKKTSEPPIDNRELLDFSKSLTPEDVEEFYRGLPDEWRKAELGVAS